MFFFIIFLFTYSSSFSQFHSIVDNMGIFSFSDIVITSTLLINALALLSSKIPSQEKIQIKSNNSSSKTEQQNAKDTDNLIQDDSENAASETQPSTTVVSRFYLFIHGIRQFSCIIVLWNVFFMVLMFAVFRE